MKQETYFYVTTPIYYVTDRPHLGTLYSTLIADVIARYNKLQGKEVFFLTGTDEHGQKIAQAAQKAGKEPQEFVDKFIPIYKDIWKKYHIRYSHFIRTTDHEHVQAVQAWLQKLIDKGDIYKARYEGWYCTPCETYLTEKEAAEIKQGEEAPRCPTCNRLTHFVSEESYFFKLSAYQDKLLEFYKNNPDFVVPKERFAEVLSFVQSGLKDLSISRSTITWGIPFPHDSKHVTYVWADALNNYITGVGYAQKGHEKKFATWWPADVHVLGKDIIRFHAVYWPAFLMASGLELPKKLLVHGWIKINDQKMTKSTGNVVDPEVLYEQFGNDTVRYYLMRYIAVTQDSSFYYEELEKAISSDLANDLGNLLNRSVTLATRNNVIEIQHTNWSSKAQTLRDQGYAMIKAYTNYMDNYLFHMALAEVWKFIHQVNAYFHEAEPWKLIKEDKNAFQEVIAATCNSLYIIASVLWPIMPEKVEQLCASLGNFVAPHLGQNLFNDCAFNPWDRTFKLVAVDPLFKKPDVVKSEEKKEPAAPIAQETISFDEFAKVQLVVGTIEQCEIIPKSDKLYKMQVNFGPLGMRQILAGVRNYFKPEELIHKQTIFVVNLQPRAILGLESQGMMLVAPDADGTSKMTTVAQSVPNGTRLR